MAKIEALKHKTKLHTHQFDVALLFTTEFSIGVIEDNRYITTAISPL